MSKYDSLIPTNAQTKTAPAVSKYAALIPPEKPATTTPKTTKTKSPYANIIREAVDDIPDTGVPFKNTKAPAKVSANKYDALVPEVGGSTADLFRTTAPDGMSLGFSIGEKDPSGKPYFAYRKPGDTATTTDYTRIAVPFDPRKTQVVTRDSFANPRAVENRAALKEAMGGAYSDELDHKIAVALSGSNNPKNLRSIPAEENDDSSIIAELQKEVMSGKKSLFEAQVALAKKKGIDIPWTPADTKEAKKSTFGSFLKKVGTSIVTAPKRGFDYAVDQLSETDLIKGAVAGSEGKELLAEKILKPATFGFTNAENIPLGVGEVIKRGKEYIDPSPDNPYARLTFSDYLTGVKDTGKEVIKFPVNAALTVTGSVPSLLTNGKGGQFKFSVPGLGEFSSSQYKVAERVRQGEDPLGAIVSEAPNAIFESLFFLGLGMKTTQGRPVTIAKGEQPTGITVKEPIRSFKIFKEPSFSKPLSPEFVTKMAEQKGVTLGPKYNPELPTYFRVTGKTNGKIVGEVVQVKPSYWDTFKSKFQKKPAAAPETAYLPLIKGETNVKSLSTIKPTVVETPVVPPVVTPPPPANLEIPATPETLPPEIPTTSSVIETPVETAPVTLQTPQEILKQWDTNKNGKLDPGEAPATMVNKYENLVPKVKENPSVQALKTAYINHGVGESGFSKADEAMGEILVGLEVAEKGYRQMIPNDTGPGWTIKAKSSTFPDWIPEKLRSRKAIDTLLSNIQSIETIKYPNSPKATAQRAFVDALLDETDKRLSIDTKELRRNIIKAYESKTPDRSPKEIPTRPTRGGRERPIKKYFEEDKKPVQEVEKSDKEVVEEVISRFSKLAPQANLTTKILERLKGRATVSKQFISDLTNSGDVKQVEKDLIRAILERQPDMVNVQEFIQQVQAELLPLKVKNSDLYTPEGKGKNAFRMVEEGAFTPKYEGISLPDDVRGDVANYRENIYESPVNTSAGDVHFNYHTKNYFGHSRVEDMADGVTRRIIEVQSDLYQKGNLEREIPDNDTIVLRKLGLEKEHDDLLEKVAEGKATTREKVELNSIRSEINKVKEEGTRNVARLQQYNNPTAHFRMVREEIQKAATDDIETLLFPTGETAMKIEGLGDSTVFRKIKSDGVITGTLTPGDIDVGMEIYGNGNKWVVTDVLGDGKFKAVPKSNLGTVSLDDFYKKADASTMQRFKSNQETFDISGKVDTNNPIYRFYEKDLGRYLKNNYEAKSITDDKGVTWYEVDIDTAMASEPIQAFKKFQLDEEVYESTIGKEIRFNTDEEGINEVFAQIFNPGEITVQGRPNMTVAGEYLRLKSEGSDVPRNHINLLTVNDLMSKDVALHEAGHAIFNMFKTHKYRKELLDRVKKFGAFTNYKKYKSYATDDLKAEEWLMDDFADWHNARFGGPKYKGMFARLWEQFTQFLKNLRRKFVKADRFYEDIMSKKRPRPGTKAEDSVTVRIRNKELKPGERERMDAITKEGQRNAAAKAERDLNMRRGIPEAAKELPVVESLFGSLKSAMNPLRAVDPKTREIFKQWNVDIIQGRERVRTEYNEVKAEIPAGMEEINAYEAGKSKHQELIKKIFDDLGRESNARGIDVDYVENYLPHVYANNPKDTQEKILRYLEGKGLSPEEAIAYYQDKPLKIEQARRLKLSPTFNKDRVLESYAAAKEIGLMPKYENVSDLVAYYVAELEKSVANRRLLDELLDAGKIKPEVSAPGSWSTINPQVSPTNTYKAPAQLARLLNGIFPDTNVPSFGRKLLNITADTSKKLQEITLSAGVPFSNFNYFSTGQMIKEVTAGNFGVIKPYIRANFNERSLRYFEEKAPIIRMMGDEGIDLGGRLGKYGEKTFKELVQNKEWTKAFGAGFAKAFNEKTFASFLPQMQIGLFEKVYNGAKNKGLSETAARELAGSTVKNNFGLLTEDFARSGLVKDMMSTFFFAPRFREGIVRTLAKTGYAGWNFIKNPKEADPRYRRNLYLLAGMAITFAMYQMINKQTSGNYTWENPDGRKFAIRIPIKNGDVMYVEFMPSFFAFPRMLATGAIATAEGDFKMAAQKFGGLLSSPIKLITDVIGNEDYFGREIYKDTDTTSTKAQKIGAYLFLSANHPYVRELVNIITEKHPLYQSISTMLEFPLKFSSLDKESKADFYKSFRIKQKEEARAKEKFLPTFKIIEDLIAQGNKVEAQRRVDELSEEDYAIFKSLRASMKAKETAASKGRGKQIYDEVKRIMSTGDDAAALEYLNSVSDEDYKAYKSVNNSLK